MGRCCICGKETDPSADGLLINGQSAPVCDECGKSLDMIEALDLNDPERDAAFSALQARMRASGAPAAVIETVTDIFLRKDTKDLSEPVSGAEEEEDRPSAETDGEEYTPIERLTRFLSGFAVVFLIFGLLGSVILGVAMISTSGTGGVGWGVLIYRLVATVLLFAVIMLMLEVASAIGRIDVKMNETNSLLRSLNEKKSRTASPARSRRK